MWESLGCPWPAEAVKKRQPAASRGRAASTGQPRPRQVRSLHWSMTQTDWDRLQQTVSLQDANVPGVAAGGKSRESLTRCHADAANYSRCFMTKSWHCERVALQIDVWMALGSGGSRPPRPSPHCVSSSLIVHLQCWSHFGFQFTLSCHLQ